MSFLTPLYVLGLSAVVAPILFHLIRRSPRGEVPFSSLMFLAPTPPRLTRRSRLDHLLLLALRAAALCLLAFAFGRPFLRQAARLDFGDVERRRIAVLIDTSASMRRGDLWPRAVALARSAITDCRPADQLAVFAFDATSRPLLGFHESSTLDPARRQAVALGLLDHLAPSWGGTNLGQALIDAVAAIEDVADASEKAGRMPRRVILISDLPQGSRLDALGDFEWPSDVDLDLKTVADHGSNAGLQVLADSAETGSSAARERRVRVFNDPSSRRDRFELLWVDERGASTDKPIDVYVPAGESRVVKVPRPRDPASHRSLRLEGDGHGFDNTLFFADGKREDTTVLFVGPDRSDDHAGLLYYLERVFVDTPRRSVRIIPQLPGAVLAWEPNHSPPLVVLTGETSTENVRQLKQYVQSGGTLLYVVAAPGRAESLAALAGVPPWNVEEAVVGRDGLMLREIAFDHPLFAPLAGAQFNDFTKIRFWKYRRINDKSLAEARVLARLETGDAAVIEKSDGKGKLVVLASGWRPADSQLARSSKFVPLLTALLEARDPSPAGGENHVVYDRVPLPAGAGAAQARVVHTPDGVIVKVTPGEAFFADTDQPGLYTLDTPDGARSFAVNLDPLESKTTPLHVESLEQFGCRLADHSPRSVDREQLRQMFNMELENRQKLWRWLILAAIGVLIVETWLAGRSRERRRLAGAEALLT